MYKILYDNDFLFDPFDDSRVVYNASITNNVNAASYLDFTVTSAHPMYDKIEERSGIITVYWDNEELFQGQITKIELDLDGNKTVACSSALDWLREVQLRPYSTDEAECKEYEFPLDKAPEGLDGYFQWVIDQYNATNLDDRRFDIDVNQANGLTSKNHVYFASTSPQTVADAIESNILDAYGGYLVLRYVDHRLVLDLYSDIHEMNPQIIDFAENILDITKTEDTNDQYTAVLPLGKSPQYTAKQQKYHDEKDAYDKRMKERDAAQKSKIDRLRKEEEAERKRIDGIKDKQAKKAAQDALKRRQDARRKDEDAFRKETERLQNEQKIKDDANNADKTKTNPIDISSLPDGGLPTDLDLYKKGDVVYSMTAVERYGYKEYVYTDNEVEDKQELLKLAGVMLRKLMAPALSIDVKAIDRALYQPEHTHLFVGQAVRVRSKIHGIDEFMMVSSIKLDLTDPSQTTATLGVAYDTLTGQQSSYLKSLNSQIDASVDVVTKVENNVKNTEITLGQVQQVVSNVNDKTDLVINNVGDYKWQTDVAWDSANEAQNTADEANEKADVNKESINNLKTEVDTSKAETEEAMGQMSNEMAAIAQKAEDIRAEAQEGIEEAKASIEQVRSDANAAVESVRGDLAETDTKAQDAATKAQQAMDGLTDANTKIEGLETSVDRNTEAITNANGEIVGVKEQITGVATTANSALSVATTNTLSLKEQSNRIDTAYSDIESARTTISEVKQTADGVKLNLETNYLDKTQTASTYATQAQLTATSKQISTSVSKKYATIETVEGLQNIADAAIETWSGRVNPTNSNPPASTWTTDALKRQHTGDIYYNMDTGKSYRWGSTDGTSYSWAMIADNDITKALADAAKAQATAEGAKTDVANLSNKVKAEYVSNSTFNQTAESIRTSVTEAASTANAASEKAAALEVRANGIDATLREQASTLNNHTTTIGQLSVKADGLQGKFEQSVDMANLTNGRGDNFIVDPGFENAKYWNLNGSTLSVGKSGNSHTGSNCMRVAGSIRSSIPLVHPYGDTSESAKKMVSVIPGHRYRMSFWFKSSASCTVNTANNKLRISNTNDTLIEACNAFPVSTTYVQRTKDWVCPANITSVYLKWNMEITSGEYWIDDISFIDVTADAKGSEALTKTATLEAGLNGFKQTVEETYTTKKEFADLSIGGTNLLLDTQKFGNANPNQVHQYNGLLNGTGAMTVTGNAALEGTKYDSGFLWRQLPKSVTTNNPDGAFYSVTVKPGATYTFSFEAWGDAEFWVYFYGPDGYIRVKKTTCTTGGTPSGGTNTDGNVSFRGPGRTWKRHVITWELADTGSTRVKTILFRRKGTTGYFCILAPKLEEGTIATEWSPSPYDTFRAADVNTKFTSKSEFTQTTNEIRGTVQETAETVEGHTNSIANLSLKAKKFALDIQQNSETAQGISQRTSNLEQDLSGYKTTVSNTYSTKTETQDKINAIAVGSVNYCKYGDYKNTVNGITGLAYDRATNIYEFDVPTTTNSTWGGGIGARNEASNKMTIPWGEWGTLTFDVYASAECIVKSDINNWCEGSSGNDNDIRSRMTLCPPSASLVLESSTASGAPSFRIPANTWVRLGFSIYNGNTSANPNKKDIRSYTHILCIPKSAVYHVKVRNIKFERGNKPTAWSPAPDDMLDKATAQETYSTKSYVDQKAKSVSIGVVEAYKRGEHGDKLTTSSQLQAMKDSITSTVASTYESKSDATLKGKAIDGLINPDFTTGTTYGWSGHNYVGRISTVDASVGGPYLVCERFTPNSGFRITNNGVITVKPGNTYRVSANLRASHDFIKTELGMFLRKANDTLISVHRIAVRADFDAAGNVWTYRYVDIKIPDKITAIKIGFGAEVTSAAGHFVIKGLRIEDVTLALAAQDTANKGMKQSSEAIQSLEKFQQSVEETYVKGEDLSGGSTNILIDTKAFGNANPNGATNGLPGVLGFPTNTSYQGLTIREIPASNTSANQVICEYAIKDCQGGQWYTASFFAKGSGTFQAYFYTNGNVVESKTVANDSYSGVTTTSGGDGRAEIKVDGRWRRYNVSWRLDPKNTSVFEKRFLLRRDATSGNIAVCGVKLEKGTIPSDWSPSPFDLAQQTSLNGELTKYTEKTTFEQTKKSFEWNIKSLAKYGPDKIPNGDPRSDLETIMAIEKDSNPPVYTFTVNNTSAPTRTRVSRTIFTLTSALIANRTYRFSFEARVVSGSVPSADHIRLVCSNDNWSGYWPWLDGSGLGTTWKTFTGVVKVTQNCTKGAIEYNATTTGSKKFYIRNISIMDVTEGANAQSGVNELDTLIRYTSNGIEVGRKTNGQYTGPKALVNSNGSFDVVKADNTLVSRLGENLMGIMRDPTLNDYRYSLSTFISPAAGQGKERRGVNMKSYGSFMLNGIPCNAATDMIGAGASNEAKIPLASSNSWFYLKMNLKSLQDTTFTIANAATFRSDYYKKVDAINNGTTTTTFDSRYFDHCLCCATANNNSSDTSVTAGAQRQVMITSPGLYGIVVHVHGYKPNTANSFMDLVVEQMSATASSYSMAPNMRFRIFETSDKEGFIQKQTPIVFNKFDVGTRLRIGFQASHSGFELSTWSKIYIVRMPFSSIIG